MSKDGTVHEFNSNTILFLQQLLSFADAVRSILYPHDVDSDTVTMEVSSSVQVDVQHDTDADESEEQPSDSQESKGNDNQRALSPYVCECSTWLCLISRMTFDKGKTLNRWVLRRPHASVQLAASPSRVGSHTFA
nr:exocyst complex component 7-like [Oncorhynchus nerka]